MVLLQRLVFAAACAGLLTGLLVTVVHQIGTVPVILRAESYEKAAEANHAALAEAPHEHERHVWEPRDGVERTAYTALADILASIGYGLLLAAAFALAGSDIGPRAGLWWGLAGFATFTLAPGLGLPPELPGAGAAPLLDRQLWWLAAALATGCGLALLAFAQRWIWTVLGLVLIVLPHLWGAPQAAEPGGTAPAVLAHQFVAAATVVSLLAWVALGILTACFYQRFGRPDASPSQPPPGARRVPTPP